jgi:aminomethyltransferase
MSKTTQLHEFHQKEGHMTEFAGYDMPVWYSSISEEHLAVRNKCGVFDVSHMGRISVTGPDSGRFLDGLVPSNISSQPPGKAVYTLFLNDNGGILEDLIVVKLSEEYYLVVVNAVNTQKDLEHILNNHRESGSSIADITGSTAMLAIQGPDSSKILQPITSVDLGQLKRFRCVDCMILGRRGIVSRTGYTGEDGFELIIYDATAENPSNAVAIWEEVIKTARPCGLGARDTLRIEAGYPLYGADIDTETNPFEADLAWVISNDKKDYIGSTAIAKVRGSIPMRIRRGMTLDQKIPRAHFELLSSVGSPIGKVTSGTFSPILRKGIAMGLVSRANSEPGEKIHVVVRDSVVEANVVKPPFYDERQYGWKRVSNGK